MTIPDDVPGSTDDLYGQRVFPSPSKKLLADIYQETRLIRGRRWRNAQDEQHAEEALRLVVNALRDLNFNQITPATPAQARALIAAADEWTSLASSICCRVYAPASPMPKRLLKWSRKVAGLLRTISSMIERPISAAASFLGASSWTVAVGFPWGVSLGLEFDTSAGFPAQDTANTDDKTVEELQQQLAEAQEALTEAQIEIGHLTALQPMSQELLDDIAKLKGRKPPSSEEH